MSVPEYVGALRRRWFIIVMAVAVALAAAWFTTSSIVVPKKLPKASSYSATNLMSGSSVGVLAPLGGGLGNLNALPTFLTIGEVPRRVADALDYNRSPQALVGLIQTEANPETGFLTITSTAPDPKWAADVANEFSDQLMGWIKDRQRKLGRERTRSLEKELAEARTEIAEIESKIPLSSGFEAKVMTAQRDAKVSRYQLLFEGYEQVVAATSGPIGLDTIQAAKPVPIAEPDGGFKAPQGRPARLALAGVLGLLAGVVLALVLERLDTRLRTKEEAEEHFSLPVLAEIPRLSRLRRRRQGAFTPRSAATDAFVLLATTLLRRLEPQRGENNGEASVESERDLANAILVTSPGPGDGKTTVAANLAAGFSEMGSRALVMSCDFRHPQVHQLLGVSNIHGLSDAIHSANGKPVLDRRVLEGKLGDLDLEVVPSGPPPNHPGELLSSEVMRRALLEARRRADVVILDSPALLAASDATLLFPEVDAVLVVARAGHTTERDARRTHQLLSRLKVPEAGVALNGVGEDATSRRYLESSELPTTKRKGFPQLVGHRGRH